MVRPDPQLPTESGRIRPQDRSEPYRPAPFDRIVREMQFLATNRYKDIMNLQLARRNKFGEAISENRAEKLRAGPYLGAILDVYDICVHTSRIQNYKIQHSRAATLRNSRKGSAKQRKVGKKKSSKKSSRDSEPDTNQSGRPVLNPAFFGPKPTCRVVPDPDRLGLGGLGPRSRWSARPERAE